MKDARDRYYGKDLVALAERTADGTGDPVRLVDPTFGLALNLKVTAAATLVGHTLDVFVQTLLGGAEWIDVAHFTQVLGNGGAKHFVAKVPGSPAQTEFETGTALAAAAVRALYGDAWRARWVIVGGTFTFSVGITPHA